MANQTITTSTNHDALTGRAAGEDITIQQGAKLTIDSMPHLTVSGILGDILLTSGEVHIDGTKVKEVAYSSGSGTFPTAIPTSITWDSGASTGKIIRYNSGTGTSGVMTITVITGTLEANDTITDGTWSATVDTVKVGYLIVFGEDQVWDATDATCTMRITGDWYEIGTGTGADSQVVNLPIAGGWQHAVWVETGSGTGVYEIWHRVYQNGVNGSPTSAVFYDSVSDWGNSFETGFVYSNDRSAGTITFGTSTNGGVPPNGAKIRIPNVHIGTTTVAAPTTEYVGVAIGSNLEILDGSVTENVFIDHLNCSTAQCSLIQTNGATISDSVFGLWSASSAINKCNAAVSITNCAYIGGSSLTGDSTALAFIILDNIGGITITDCIFYCSSATTAFTLTTMANLLCTGTNKFTSTQQDENTAYAISGGTASNIIFEDTTIILAGGLSIGSACVNWEIENLVYSQPTARGTTEDSISVISILSADQITIQGGRFATGGGVRHPNANFALLTDASNVKIRNFGEVDAKIDCGGRGTTVLNLAGITNNCLFQRLYFTNRNTAAPFTMLNSDADITIENCSCDYNDELEAMANRVLMKGVHGASGNIGTATGWEDDYVNVLASIFYDCFKSDTAGGVGLLFNDRGVKHLGDVSFDVGTPVFNGIGDLLMPALNDQITYTFPYWIKGHTGFTSILPHLIGVNCGTLGSGWGNFNIQYDLDTGSGFSGTFDNATTTNLTGETISAAGFRIKIRIICTTASSTNSINGLQIHTSTTIADQKANYYPLNVVTLAVTGLQTGSDVVIYKSSDGSVLSSVDANATTSWDYVYETIQNIDIGVFKAGYIPFYIRGLVLTASNSSVPVAQIVDRAYLD